MEVQGKFVSAIVFSQQFSVAFQRRAGSCQCFETRSYTAAEQALPSLASTAPATCCFSISLRRKK
jgi:hypothetical protein